MSCTKKKKCCDGASWFSNGCFMYCFRTFNTQWLHVIWREVFDGENELLLLLKWLVVVCELLVPTFWFVFVFCLALHKTFFLESTHETGCAFLWFCKKRFVSNFEIFCGRYACDNMADTGIVVVCDVFSFHLNLWCWIHFCRWLIDVRKRQ